MTKKSTLTVLLFILIILVYSYSYSLTFNKTPDNTDSKNWSVIKVGSSISTVKLSQDEPLWTQWDFWLYVAIAVIITLGTRRFLTRRGIRIWALYRQ